MASRAWKKEKRKALPRQRSAHQRDLRRRKGKGKAVNPSSSSVIWRQRGKKESGFIPSKALNLHGFDGQQNKGEEFLHETLIPEV